LPTFPHGFPDDFILDYQAAIGRPTLGNVVASGTEIIARLGEAHLETGDPIVYTSADSVFQLAAHEDAAPLRQLYQWCETAREMLRDDLAVGRVIARPFAGALGHFQRTANRHDYSLDPVGPTVLDSLVRAGKQVLGVGKIKDIYNGRGITGSQPTKSNADGIAAALAAMDQLTDGLVFVNLVDFDMLYGHRNDPTGYGQALAEADRLLAPLADRCEKEGFLLMITADHGNDPTTADTDHNREYVPLLVCGQGIRPNADLGIRRTFADIAATIAERHQLDFAGPGESFWPAIKI
jgi:phosphopentomutase